jgi:hypothetical protein
MVALNVNNPVLIGGCYSEIMLWMSIVYIVTESGMYHLRINGSICNEVERFTCENRFYFLLETTTPSDRK